MMDRRPHWTDDLIEAVKDAISGWCFDRVEGPLYDEDVYPVIAAVEDWQKRQDIGGDWGTVAWSVRMYQHYVTSEAAIARVREQLHKPWKYECECCTRIWIALDGDIE